MYLVISTVARGCRRWLHLHKQAFLRQSYHSQLRIWFLTGCWSFSHPSPTWPILSLVCIPLCHDPAMVLSTLLAQEAGSWTFVCPNDGNFPPWAWNSGVQAVLLHRAGPPVTTWPAVSIMTLTRVRRGESGVSRASELGVHERGSFPQAGPEDVSWACRNIPH